MVRRSLDVDHHAYVEPAERGRHDNNNEEDYRVGGSGEVWRRGDPHDQRPPENRKTPQNNRGPSQGLNNFRTPAASFDPVIATVHYPTATNYRYYAHLILESASPDKHGGSHSK
jgi:hypothetical protein